MDNRRHILFLLGFLLFLATQATAQDANELFRSDSILEFNIVMPQKEVLNDRKERNKHQASLSYVQNDGEVIEHQLKVKVRGKTRTLRQICTFPPLYLYFNKADTKNTIFEGQKKLKLVSHCRNEGSYEKYVQKEYIVYKMYQIVSPYSFNVRLCRVNYTDTDNPRKSGTHYAILIEDIKDLAKRKNLHVLKDSVRIQEVVDKESLDKLVMFQYMIGNHDWSIPHRHNMKLVIGDKGALPFAVPYDFDYCGLVDTPYAVPPKETNLTSVRERDFRGFCRQNGYDDTVQFYKEIQPELFDVIENSHFLSGRNRSEMTAYLSTFFHNIEDPKYVDRQINRACRVKHKHKYM